MRGDKTAVYRNELGQEVIIDNWAILLEKIDMTGTTGVHTAEGLAGADGQYTVESRLGAKTIPCSFAIHGRRCDALVKEWLAQVFSPLLSGVLTVYTKRNKYSIDVKPQDAPSFERDQTAPYIWRFDVDFVADFPYWRMGEELSTGIVQSTTTIVSDCVHELPLRVYFPVPASNESMLFVLNDKGFSVSSTIGGTRRDFPIWVDTKNCTVTDADGNNTNQWVDETAPLNVMKLHYGTNTVGSYLATGYTVYYYKLSLGEV